MRVVPLIIFFIKSKLAGTERAKARCWSKQLITYGAWGHSGSSRAAIDGRRRRAPSIQTLTLPRGAL